MTNKKSVTTEHKPKWWEKELAFAGAWQQLVFLVIGVILALWVLSAMGIALPSLP